MAQFTVSESNLSGVSVVAGNLAKLGSDFQVLGVDFAGRSSKHVGAGQSFQGIFGSIRINPDGTFAYSLDNTDADTNLIGTGETATERFTFTYSLNGGVFTDVVTFAINGVDEADQVTRNQTGPLDFNGAFTIAANERLSITDGRLLATSSTSVDKAQVDGSLYFTTTGPSQLVGLHLVNHYYSWSAGYEFTNNGRISLVNLGTNVQGSFAVGSVTTQPIVNNGVIAIRYAVDGGSGIGATGVGGNLVNNGLVESVADHMASYGVQLDHIRTNVVNNGVIRASGGEDAWRISGIDGVGGNHIVNHGTIEAWSRTGGKAAGILIFANSTNPYALTTIENSGRIVATHAVRVDERYNTAITMINTGYVEGNYTRDFGVDVVINDTGGEWRGDLNFGSDLNQFRNAGLVTGIVSLGGGGDYYDGRGGVVVGEVRGAAGNDVLIGGDGSDTLLGGAGDDVLRGGLGPDRLTGGEGADLFVIGAGESTAAARDVITDFVSGVDRIDLSQLGNASVTITAGAGMTTVAGTSASGSFSIAVQGSVAASDIVLAAPSIQLAGTEAADVLLAAVPGSTLLGGGGGDTLVGSDGNDRLDGGSGVDMMFGGFGDDFYFVDVNEDRLIEEPGGGHDTVRSPVEYALQAWVEDGVLLGEANVGLGGNGLNNVLSGNTGNNTIYGYAGDDTLVGNRGADTLLGGTGADRFVYLDPTDSTASAMDYLQYFEHGVDVIDLVQIAVTDFHFDEFRNPWSSSHWTTVTIGVQSGPSMVIRVDGTATMADFLLNGSFGAESLVGTDGSDTLDGGLGDDVLDGRLAPDTLIGGAGNDTLIGGGGADGLVGGTGNDVYFVDDNSDVVIERAGEGKDRVVASVSYALAAGAEVETLETDSATGTAAFDLAGSNSANTIHGNAGANRLLGEGGNDTLHGAEGSDYLVGGAGLDNLYGGAGDDRFYIGSADGDRIWEFAGEGYDTVASEVDYELPDVSHVERLEAGTLSATTALQLGGSNLDNAIIGNEGANRLRGFAGGDTLQGLGGDDTLIGDEGADVMYGGTGNDTYYVNTSDDRIFENEGEGTNDRVATEISFTLPDEAEVEVLEAVNLGGTAVRELGGSRYANTITGDAGNNVLRGYGGKDTLSGHLGDDVLIGDEGADTMIGGQGNDTYYVDNAADVVVEAAGQGSDRVSTSVSYTLAASAEVETLEASSLGSTASLNLAGNSFANILIGNNGANVLDGQGGNDVLIGAGGADAFVFSTALGAGNIDRIEGFQSSSDTIVLDRAIFTAIQDGALAAGALTKGTVASSADHRIIHDDATGALFYDADGSGGGAAIQFAWLQAGTTLTGRDFVLASSTTSLVPSISAPDAAQAYGLFARSDVGLPTHVAPAEHDIGKQERGQSELSSVSRRTPTAMLRAASQTTAATHAPVMRALEPSAMLPHRDVVFDMLREGRVEALNALFETAPQMTGDGLAAQGSTAHDQVGLAALENSMTEPTGAGYDQASVAHKFSMIRQDLSVFGVPRADESRRVGAEASAGIDWFA